MEWKIGGSMINQVVRYSKQGSTGFVTINRPEVKNLLNMAVFQSLDKALDEAGADKEVRVVVVTGSGNAFGAGADISELLVLDTQGG